MGVNTQMTTTLESRNFHMRVSVDAFDFLIACHLCGGFAAIFLHAKDICLSSENTSIPSCQVIDYDSIFLCCIVSGD